MHPPCRPGSGRSNFPNWPPIRRQLTSDSPANSRALFAPFAFFVPKPRSWLSALRVKSFAGGARPIFNHTLTRPPNPVSVPNARISINRERFNYRNAISFYQFGNKSKSWAPPNWGGSLSATIKCTKGLGLTSREANTLRNWPSVSFTFCDRTTPHFIVHTIHHTPHQLAGSLNIPTILDSRMTP